MSEQQNTIEKVIGLFDKIFRSPLEGALVFHADPDAPIERLEPRYMVRGWKSLLCRK